MDKCTLGAESFQTYVTVAKFRQTTYAIQTTCKSPSFVVAKALNTQAPWMNIYIRGDCGSNPSRDLNEEAI